MSSLDHSLQRLFKAAAQAPREAPGPLPSAWACRTLAQWRSTAGEDESALLAALFWRGVVCASLVMVLSMGWSCMGNDGAGAGAKALANYALTIQLLP
jgi:hypothetical protein